MKEAKFALSIITALGFIGTLLALNVSKRSLINVYTTDVYCATATKTLTHATVTVGISVIKYYTYVDNQRACLSARFTKSAQ